MGPQLDLRQILQKIIGDCLPILLSDRKQDWEAVDLLNSLSESMLSRRAYFQPGLYIAEISEKGYLGTVLYRIKPKPASI
jgi:hypothetical protein